MPRPRKYPLPEDPDATVELPVTPGPRVWSGKVHDPGKIFMREMDEKKAARNSDFQAGQTKNIVSRMGLLEQAQERTEQKLDMILKALKPQTE